MIEVVVAENAGFCPGVRAATIKLADRISARREGERLYTLGHLIHNEDYNRSLEEQGVFAVKAEELSALAATATPEQPVTVFIRAHGIPTSTRRMLFELSESHPGFSFVDCTCPFVSKIHRIAADSSADGGDRKHIFLCIGSEHHPEVEGFMSCFEGEKHVFADAEELERALGGLDFASKRPIMVAQTTQKLTEWKKSQKILKNYCTNALIFDTICNVTEVGGQAVLGRQFHHTTPWLTERHGYYPT